MSYVLSRKPLHLCAESEITHRLIKLAFRTLDSINLLYSTGREIERSAGARIRTTSTTDSPSRLQRREKDGEVTASGTLAMAREALLQHMAGEGDDVGGGWRVVVGAHDADIERLLERSESRTGRASEYTQRYQHSSKERKKEAAPPKCVTFRRPAMNALPTAACRALASPHTLGPPSDLN